MKLLSKQNYNSIVLSIILILLITLNLNTTSAIEQDPINDTSKMQTNQIVVKTTKIKNEYNNIIDFLESLPYKPNLNQGIDKGLVNHFNPNDIREISNTTAVYIDNKLEGTNLEGLGQDYIVAEKMYGVNALFLVGLSVHESGWAKSKIAIDKNNLFGFGAYDSNPYENAVKFDSMGDSILRAAGHISYSYLEEEGKYYNGYSIWNINQKWCTDKKWANKIINTVEYNLQ